ncbi:MAG: GtrA family protein [Bacilli bacterium]|nr:GtrA family protein [Bacilli bacterium]
MENNKANKNIYLEILRFIIVGGGATIIDFLCQLGIKTIPWPTQMGGWIEAVATVVGFAVSTVFNYVLSLLWVFKNVENEKKSKSKLYMFLFVLFSAIGLGIGIGLQYAGRAICMNAWGYDISLIGFKDFNLASAPFWGFAVVFVIKTLITLIYNYCSRKFILFKAPKEK